MRSRIAHYEKSLLSATDTPAAVKRIDHLKDQLEDREVKTEMKNSLMNHEEGGDEAEQAVLVAAVSKSVDCGMCISLGIQYLSTDCAGQTACR